VPREHLYRPDIDGLRAIAVLIVVAFHVGSPGFTGGFVGVDVFFVISGFLITGLLVDEIVARQRLGIAAFYARRVRRLLPALMLVSIATVLLGCIFLLPIDGQQQHLAESALATAFSASNFYFWLTTEYFSNSSDLLPLLHTWSLAVEEQYYLFWPPVILGLFLIVRRRGPHFRTALRVILAIALVGSLILSGWMTQSLRLAAFYLVPTRAWEFALGGLAVLSVGHFVQIENRVRVLLAVCGAIAVTVAAVAFNDRMLFPGTAALLPALGTVVLVAAGCGGDHTLAVRLLSSKPLVQLGLLSYSWYLWHWPLLAIARARDLGQRSLPRDVAIALLALALAWLTYRFVENPIRTRRPGPFRNTGTTLIAGAAMSALLVASAGALELWAQDPRHLDPGTRSLADAALDRPSHTAECMLDQDARFQGLATAEVCTTGSTPPVSLVLWGDSHANHLFPLMETASQEFGTQTREVSRASCPPLIGVVPFFDGHANAECGRFNEAALAEIEGLAQRGLRGVVLAGRWTAYVGQGQPNPREGAGASLSYGESRLDPQASLRALELGLERSVSRLTAAGLRVLVIGEIPELYFRAPACLARRTPEQCALNRDAVDERRGPVMARVRGATASAPAAILVDPIDSLCDDHLCYPIRDGIVMYFDSQHLTAHGAQSLFGVWRPQLEWATAVDPVAVAAHPAQ
jgi:peptidoglycan/LPS O-acetylase OafA/YrhL